MASNENDAQINNAILNLVHRGRGHGPLGKKMILPKPEGEAELALRPSKEPPPGYEDETPPYYDGKGKEPSSADKASVAEKKAPVAAEKAPVVPEEAPAPLKPPHPLLPPQEDRSHLYAKFKKMMNGLGNMVKTEQEVEQGTKLSDCDIAQRADAHFIKKNLKLRYFHECSEEHFNEFKNLVSKGMSVDEARAAHSDFGAWMFIESERERFRS